MPIILSLCNFVRANPESAIIIKKTNFSYLQQAISELYLQKHPHALNFEVAQALKVQGNILN